MSASAPVTPRGGVPVQQHTQNIARTTYGAHPAYAKAVTARGNPNELLLSVQGLQGLQTALAQAPSKLAESAAKSSMSAAAAAWRQHAAMVNRRTQKRQVQHHRAGGPGAASSLQHELDAVNDRLESTLRRLERAEAFAKQHGMGTGDAGDAGGSGAPADAWSARSFRAAPMWSPVQDSRVHASNDREHRPSAPSSPRTAPAPPTHRAAPPPPPGAADHLSAGHASSTTAEPSAPLAARVAPVMSQSDSPRSTTPRSTRSHGAGSSQGSHGSRRPLGTHVAAPWYLKVNRNAGRIPASQEHRPAPHRKPPSINNKEPWRPAAHAPHPAPPTPQAPRPPPGAPHRAAPHRPGGGGGPPAAPRGAGAPPESPRVPVPWEGDPATAGPGAVKFHVLHTALASYDTSKAGSVPRGHVLEICRTLNLGVSSEIAGQIAMRHLDSTGRVRYSEFVHALAEHAARHPSPRSPRRVGVPARKSVCEPAPVPIMPEDAEHLAMTCGHTAANHRLHQTLRESMNIVWGAQREGAHGESRSSTPRGRYSEQASHSAVPPRHLTAEVLAAHEQAERAPPQAARPPPPPPARPSQQQQSDVDVHANTWEEGQYQIDHEHLKRDPMMAMPSRSKMAAAIAASNSARNIHYEPTEHGVPKIHEMLA